MTITLTNDEADLIINRVIEIDSILVMLAKIEGKENGDYRSPMTNKVTSKLYEIGNLILPKRAEEEE